MFEIQLNITEQNKEPSQPPQSPKQKKELHPALFVLCLIGTVLLTYSQYISTKAGTPEVAIPMLVITFTLTYFSFTAVSIIMTQNCCQFFHLIIILDKIMAMFTIVIVGVVGAAIITTRQQTQDPAISYSLGVITLVDLLLMLAVWRIMIKNHQWKVWQVIIVKLVVMAGGIGFLVMATDTILNQWASNGFKDFVFIYIFGYYSLLTELFGKFTEIDGTNDLKYDYQPIIDKYQSPDPRLSATEADLKPKQ